MYPFKDSKDKKVRLLRTSSIEDQKARVRTILYCGKIAAAGLVTLLLLTLNHYLHSIQNEVLFPSTSIIDQFHAGEHRTYNDTAGSALCSYNNPYQSTILQNIKNRKTSKSKYKPAPVEKYIMENLVSLGYDTNGDENANTCAILNDTRSPIYRDLQTFFKELDKYNQLVKNFDPIPDLRLSMDPSSSADNSKLCERVKIHPKGLNGIFQGGQLSKPVSGGYIEPYLPTLRSHRICEDFLKYLLTMDYLIHDFHSMCLQLKKHSRTVFVDMGASLDFHDNRIGEKPAFYINHIYKKFGIQFDHIYAYEIVEKQATDVFRLVPDELQASWHWINVGVDPEPCAKMNPFTMIANNYGPDDFVVVKLDIDTPAVESVLVRQLRDDPWLLELVDQFYFEDHVHQEELATSWLESMQGTVKGSLELMSEIRKRGVAAHYWP